MNNFSEKVSFIWSEPDLLDQRVSLEEVLYVAGHSDPQTTRLFDRRKAALMRITIESIPR